MRALLLLATASAAAAVGASSSASPNASYGFSECVNNTRSLFFYADKATTCADDPTLSVQPPVHGLRCDVPCARGFFLGANFSGAAPVSGCERCPKGQYSLGGGKLFSQRTGAWSSPLPIDVHTDCVTRNLYTGKWQANCEAWNASADGAFISSGDNSEIMERFEASRLFSSLRISATFVRDGAVTYQFKVDAEAPFDGLVFTIDETAVTPLVSKTEGWREASFQVAAGAHTFSWDYTKDYSGDAGADRAFVKVVELVGTAFSDTHCHPCGGEMTMSGGSLCKFCGANEYAAAKSHSELDFTCYKCPEGTVAPKGSIGLAACVETRTCTAEDLVESFSPCVGGKRTASFAWSEPHTCDAKLPGSIALPEDQAGLPCDTCAPGFVLNAADQCERCPPGQKLGDGDDKCTKCPAGHVTVNAMAFGAGTRDGWSEWPSIVDSASAVNAGWKLTRQGIAFSAHARSDEGEWNRPNRFPLSFNATFTHSGYINLTYALSHVPTFESAGVRAWLELEIHDSDAPKVAVKKKAVPESDDDEYDSYDDSEEEEEDTDGVVLGGDVGGNIAHLTHGGENGTFTQVIRFNVTAKTTKQFSLVLRTTSPVAERLIRAKLLHLGLFGTEAGGPVACGSCPPGYEAFNAAADNDGDSNDDTTAPTCRACSAGTFSHTKNGVASCEKCPANTFSAAGAADACEPCGSNTFSAAGAQTCAAPAVLTANGLSTATMTSGSSSSVGTVAAGSNELTPSYDLSLLELLVWGNDSFFSDDTNGEPPAGPENLLSVMSVTPSGAVRVDSSHVVFLGLFRPVSKSWKDKVGGQIVEELVDAARDRPYVVELTMLNPRDAGHHFTQKTNRYGEVECAAPAQWKVGSGGSRMEIVPLESGEGVHVIYTGGSRCQNGKAANTEVHFVCDLRAGTNVAPTSASRDEEKCLTTVTWKTALACPICDASYFSELRSACSSGQQSVSYSPIKPCYGGDKPSSVPVATCNEVVLDTKAMYTVYAVVSAVGFVVLVLMAAIFVTHRKYLATYNEYMYLKGRMPTSVTTKEDGSKETTFDFSNNASAPHAASPPAPSTRSGQDFAGEGKQEEEDGEDLGVELSVRSV